MNLDMNTGAGVDLSQALWHWNSGTWNDRAVEWAVIEAVNTGRVKPRQWRWPLPGPYNGNTGQERVEGWKKTWAAVQIGLIPPPKMCSICGSGHRVQYHNEDYIRPLNARPVCADCHRILHRRFKDRVAWASLVSAYAYDGCWFADLRTDRERSREEMEREWSALCQWPIDTPAPIIAGLSSVASELDRISDAVGEVRPRTRT